MRKFVLLSVAFLQGQPVEGQLIEIDMEAHK